MPGMLDSPIPGQSLTMEPGNAPWEQPPLYADAQEALAFHLSKFEDEENLDDLLFLLDNGMPLDVLVDSLTTTGVMEGYHTVDVSLLIAPVIHEYILALAEAGGIKVVETAGPSKAEKMKERDKQRFQLLLQKALDESGGESVVLESMIGGFEGGEPEMEPEVEEVSPPAEGRGFISRRR